MYDYVDEANAEAVKIGNVLRFATSTDVRYIQGPSGNSAPPTVTDWSSGAGGDSHITNIQVLDYGAEKNGLIGFFEDDNGEELFMLTNLNHGSTLSADDATVSFQLTFDNSIDDLLYWDRITNRQTVVELDNHVLNVDLPGGTGNLYKYNNGEDFIDFVPSPELDIIDNGCPETGLHSYTLIAKGTGITVLSKFTIDGQLHQVFDTSEDHSEWLGDGSASETETTDSYVIFGDMRIPDLGGETWPGPGDPPTKITEETIDGGGTTGLGTLNNYDESTGVSDAYMILGEPSGEEIVELIHIVVPDGNGFEIDLDLVTSESYNPKTGKPLLTTHDLSFELPTLTAGDANGDGYVNSDDVDILASNWGMSSGATWADGDFDRDGAITNADAGLLVENWGAQPLSSVPEPGTLALLIGMFMAIVPQRFHR